MVGSKKAPEDKECRNRLLDVLYEMSRVQRLRWDDLGRLPMSLVLGWMQEALCDADWGALCGQRPLMMHLYHIYSSWWRSKRRWWTHTIM